MKFRAAVVVPALLVGILLSWPLLKVILGGPGLPALVPVPARIERHHGSFVLRASTRILTDTPSRETSEQLASRLRLATSFKFPVAESSTSANGNDVIELTTRGAGAGLGAEGYELTATPDRVMIRAHTPAGVFYGVQSLFQLLPPEVYASNSPPTAHVTWTVPCVEIQDHPRFKWRGFMLDVSRHFFNKAEVEQVLDLMALHKLNTFHWHLADDQGWRIEIKRYPRLTDIGAWRKGIGYGLDPKQSTAFGPDGRYGGYYTQQDIREIVAYAQARHITIVPEIEMPGHSGAALQAYPELTCSGSLDADRPSDVYCAGKEETFRFIENILDEVCALFPGEYIHIGGDEVSKQYWRDCPRCRSRMKQENLQTPEQLEAWFVHRIENYLESKGRHAIGWSEIEEGGLPENTAVMDWIGGGTEAAAKGHPVVMSPNTYCYFDYYQARDRAEEPPASGSYLPIEKVYSFEPLSPGLAPQCATNILGAQANLWTEYVPSLKQAEYMMFPRLCAFCEVVWSPPQTRIPEDFRKRLKRHLRRLDELGVNYRREPSFLLVN